MNEEITKDKLIKFINDEIDFAEVRINEKSFPIEIEYEKRRKEYLNQTLEIVKNYFSFQTTKSSEVAQNV